MLNRVFALLAALFALPANALLIEIDGQQWDVQTRYLNVAFGSYSESTDSSYHESIIKAQPWWGDSELAYRFADAVRGELGVGTPTPIIMDDCIVECRGPLFAFEAFGLHGQPLGPDDPIATPDPMGQYGIARVHSRYLNAWVSLHVSTLLDNPSYYDNGRLVAGEFLGIRSFEPRTDFFSAYAVATSVPEPGTLSLLAAGVLAALAARRRGHVTANT